MQFRQQRGFGFRIGINQHACCDCSINTPTAGDGQPGGNGGQTVSDTE